MNGFENILSNLTETIQFFTVNFFDYNYFNLMIGRGENKNIFK